jgi:hypothetical protein
MKAADRARLTAALREHVARIAADLRAQMSDQGPRADAAARARARLLHTQEQVGEAFEVWTDLLARRAAVLWVLKSVYVRVLEDCGLLAPGRILDPEAQQLFERLAPNLGESAFLRWVYRDLASPDGGLPELFSPQPAEVAAPLDALSRDLLAFWRHRDPDTGACWGFAEERFEGELMGDLYQELDPVVKDRFALCQTPDFVRAFILDRTLTPAIETFGADTVRLLDPACGSGHFLIDGLKRLVAATAAAHPDWEPRRLVNQCLGRVVGIDLNDYACALARARLVMTAAELAGVGTLAGAAQFHPQVYWADGLEQVERGRDTQGQQLDLFDASRNEAPRATLTRPEVRAALSKVLEPRFHAVVANPPYITEKDKARKDYHREKVGKGQRYVSAYREYSLASPFTERCFQLAQKDGFVGIISSNNFMKRKFGGPLIETVLAGLDLTLVVDTSQAYIPFHGTPTVLLFGRNRRPSGDPVRAVMGKRGESGTPDDPAKGWVWSSIADGWSQVGFENEYVSVSWVVRETLNKHPWSLGGGGAAELKELLGLRAQHNLADILESIGFMCITKQDDVYVQDVGVLIRQGCEPDWTRPFGMGDMVRDWAFSPGPSAIFPYDDNIGLRSLDGAPGMARYLWRFRRVLEERAVFGGGTFLTAKRPWWEYGQIPKDRFRTPLSIAFAEVATHNHFVLDRSGKVFAQTAPVIKLRVGATEDDHVALLGILNSSTICFWMKQVFHVKGGESTGKKRQSEPWSRRLQYDSTKLRLAPIINGQRTRILELARRLDALAIEASGYQPSAVMAFDFQPENLCKLLQNAELELLSCRTRMVALQEELDWTVYVAFGLAPDEELSPINLIEPMASQHRPFAIRLARETEAGEATDYWFEAMQVPPSREIPPQYTPVTCAKIERRLSLLETDETLSLLESPDYKRKWEPITFKTDLAQAAREYLADRLERAFSERSRPVALPLIIGSVQDDPRFLAVASIYQGRRDVDLTGLVSELVSSEAVPNHPYHVYTGSGSAKRQAWENVWALQRREDAGEKIDNIPVPPEYSQGSRGKSTDFLKTDYWRLRGKLDVPKERFIAFTEVPGRAGADTLFGWAGWTPVQRVRAMFTLDEQLEDSGVPLADRIALLDSAWRLLPDLAREDPAAASRLKAELQSIVGLDGPSREMLEDWRRRFPPPGGRTGRRKDRP